MARRGVTVFLVLVILLVVFAIGCVQQQKPETSSVEKTSPSEIKQTRDDFGCFSSCNSFQEPIGKQMCEDWKTGKDVQWPPDCPLLSDYPSCVKLCAAEKNEQPKPQVKERDDFGCFSSCTYFP